MLVSNWVTLTHYLLIDWLYLLVSHRHMVECWDMWLYDPYRWLYVAYCTERYWRILYIPAYPKLLLNSCNKRPSLARLQEIIQLPPPYCDCTLRRPDSRQVMGSSALPIAPNKYWVVDNSRLSHSDLSLLIIPINSQPISLLRHILRTF